MRMARDNYSHSPSTTNTTSRPSSSIDSMPLPSASYRKNVREIVRPSIHLQNDAHRRVPAACPPRYACGKSGGPHEDGQ